MSNDVVSQYSFEPGSLSDPGAHTTPFDIALEISDPRRCKVLVVSPGDSAKSSGREPHLIAGAERVRGWGQEMWLTYPGDICMHWVGKLRDQNRELDERDTGEGRHSRLRGKSPQCRVVSLPPLPMPWLAIGRERLPRYVAHVFAPLPSHVVAMCNGPAVTRARPISLRRPPSDREAAQSAPGTHASARWRVCLSAHF